MLAVSVDNLSDGDFSMFPTSLIICFFSFPIMVFMMVCLLTHSGLHTRFNLHIVKTHRVLDKIKGKLMDSVFGLSNGRVTSIGPHGEFNWQVRSLAS